ncbi:MAG: DUF1837 domain-containing protein [Acidobacteriota bacterium]
MLTLALDYCIPRGKAEAAQSQLELTGSYRSIAALVSEARSLLSDVEMSGELGELLLFALTESVLEYPQCVAKMSLKTNTRVHFHGLDGIYASASPSGRLRLHFGESKIYSSIREAISEAVDSLSEFLSDAGFTGRARRDYCLLTDNLDLGDQALNEAVLAYLDPSSRSYGAPEICAVALVGGDHAPFPRIDVARFDEEPGVPESVHDFYSMSKTSLCKAIRKAKLTDFRFDTFVLPFESASSLRGSFQNLIKVER